MFTTVDGEVKGVQLGQLDGGRYSYSRSGEENRTLHIKRVSIRVFIKVNLSLFCLSLEESWVTGDKRVELVCAFKILIIHHQKSQSRLLWPLVIL